MQDTLYGEERGLVKALHGLELKRKKKGLLHYYKMICYFLMLFLLFWTFCNNHSVQLKKYQFKRKTLSTYMASLMEYLILEFIIYSTQLLHLT